MTEPPTTPGTYSDTDLVYVDPDSKKVVGRVEFLHNDQPKPLPYKPIVKETAVSKDGKTKEEGKKDRGQFWRKFYPYGTYKSVKRIYKVEGKIKDAESNKTLEEVLPKALNEAFWTWDLPSPQEKDSHVV